MKTLIVIAILFFLIAGRGRHDRYDRHALWEAGDVREAREELRDARRDVQRELRQAREDFRREMRHAHREFRDEFGR